MTDVESTLAIRRLVDVYCSMVDDGDADGMAALFVPDGRLLVYEPGSSPGAGDPLRQWDIHTFSTLLETLKQSYVRWVHFVGNHWVDIDGDTASGQTYLFACHLRDAAGALEEEVAVIRYFDRFVRTAAGWRFAERDICRQWTTLRPVTTGQLEIDAKLHGRR